MDTCDHFGFAAECLVVDQRRREGAEGHLAEVAQSNLAEETERGRSEIETFRRSTT
jgi:hypothetical protein